MAVTNMDTLYAVSIAGTVVGGIQTQDVSPDVQEAVLREAGALYPTRVLTLGAKPNIGFSTWAVKTMLDLMIASSRVDGLDLGATPAIFYFERMSGVGRASGSVHTSLTMAKGLLIPQTLTLAQGQPAMLNCLAVTKYDGTNLPYVVAFNQALPAWTPGAAAFTLGPLKINNALVGGIQSITINFGIVPISHDSDGDLYPTGLVVGDSAPTIQAVTTELSVLTTIGLLGIGTSGTDGYAAFARKDAEAGTVAPGTAEHLKFSGTTSKVTARKISAAQPSGGRGVAAVELTIAPYHDGTNNIMSANTAAAIA